MKLLIKLPIDQSRECGDVCDSDLPLEHIVLERDL